MAAEVETIDPVVRAAAVAHRLAAIAGRELPRLVDELERALFELGVDEEWLSEFGQQVTEYAGTLKGGDGGRH